MLAFSRTAPMPARVSAWRAKLSPISRHREPQKLPPIIRLLVVLGAALALWGLIALAARWAFG